MKTVRLVALCFSLLYLGCGESENKNLENNSMENSKIENKKDSILLVNEENQFDILNELGLDIKNEKMSIDLNKTTNFFKKMEIEMHGKADELQHKIEKADINFTRDLGIDFTGEKLEIDLNKTKNMFQQLNILMKELLLDKNSSKN